MRHKLWLLFASLFFGLVLNIAAGFHNAPEPTPRCPGCAILVQPYGCHNAEAVIGGYICDPK